MEVGEGLTLECNPFDKKKWESQQWFLKYIKDETFMMISKKNGMALKMKDLKPELVKPNSDDTDKLQLWKCDKQRIMLSKCATEDDYEMLNVKNNKIFGTDGMQDDVLQTFELQHIILPSYHCVSSTTTM